MSMASNHKAIALAVVLARGGSKGLARKNVLPVGGRPMVAWTLEHAKDSKRVGKVVLSTEDAEIAAVGRACGVEVIDRPGELADDRATVDGAARHAVGVIESRMKVVCGPVVILYGNVPVRPKDLTDRALAKLEETGADSVQSVCAVGKMHPYWMKRLAGPAGKEDRLEMYEENAVYRRQDLPAVYMLDGGVIAVRRAALMTVVAGQPHAFLGKDRRAVVTGAGEVVDVDTEMDLIVAEAVMKQKAERK